MENYSQSEVGLSPNQAASKMCPAVFQNFYGSVMSVYLLFYPIRMRVTIVVISCLLHGFILVCMTENVPLVQRPLD
jgi:hypothetical protein